MYILPTYNVAESKYWYFAEQYKVFVWELFLKVPYSMDVLSQNHVFVLVTFSVIICSKTKILCHPVVSINIQ